jgi:hypothetical protein
VLAHWNNNLQVDMSLNSDTLFWFRANLLSGEATDTNFYSDFFLLFLWKNDFLCNEVCWTMLKSVVYTVIPGYVNIRYTSSALDCGQFSNFSAISWREQVNFQWEHVQVHFVLDQHAELDFIVLAHWNNNLRVDMSIACTWWVINIVPINFLMHTMMET